ncbi:anthrone oxygenase family protein [Haladaptatus halobius]|uniref:anthrone oxygenase family protein n=1 Tax=Haladaptatus halobius TaxID=2884875 RepID=UPI001D0BE457|nr:anthrone oxygenase family protein [Haladaptatus halobius]
MIQLNALSGELVVILFSLSAILGGLMAGFFFAYSVSVVLALETLSASAYTTVIQDINEKVLNVVFGATFFGAIVVPVGTAAIVLLQGDWATWYSRLFLVGVVVYLIGTFAVTMRIHIPMNEEIATWSPASPPDEWAAVRARWARWNHIRTIAAIVSFVLYLSAIVSLSM